MEGAMLGNTGKSRMVKIISLWSFIWSLIVLTRGKLPLQNQGIIGISGKGMNTSLALRTKSPNKKQKARISITGINNQDFRNFLKRFNNSPCLGYKLKHVNNEPTQDYFFLINHTYKLIKRKEHVWLLTKGVKLDFDGAKRVNKRIGNFNKTIQ